MFLKVLVSVEPWIGSPGLYKPGDKRVALICLPNGKRNFVTAASS